MENGIRTLTSTDIADVTAQRNDNFGALAQTGDGRLFRYVSAGAGGVTAGQLVVAPTTTAGHLNIAVAAAAAAGVYEVKVTLGAAAATQDQYAGGFLVVGTDASGVPVTRRIRGNTAGNGAATITVTLAHGETLLQPLTTSSVVSLIPCVYNNVTASSTAGAPIGVAVNSIPAGSYGWVQTRGPVGVINDAAGALSAFGKIKQSATVAGSVVSGAAAADLPIGYMLQGAAASKSALACLSLD